MKHAEEGPISFSVTARAEEGAAIARAFVTGELQGDRDEAGASCS